MEETINYLGSLYATNFCELGLGVSYVKGYASPLGNTYLYNLKFISQYNKKWLQSLLEKISIFHHIKFKFIETTEAHFGIMQPKTNYTLSLTNLLALNNFDKIVIGVDANGKDLTLDFNKIPHLLIAGTTGAGKSVLLMNLLINLYGFYGKNRFKKGKFVIIDPKGTEFEEFKGLYNTTIIDNTQQAITTLGDIVNEMERRYKDRFYVYHDLYVIIDELADLMLTSRFEIEEYLVRLAQKSRAVNIHLIVATQSPRVSVVSGLIKANFPYRIALKTASSRDSVVIMDKGGCEELNVGEAFFKNGIDTRLFRIAYPENELLQKCVQANKVKL